MDENVPCQIKGNYSAHDSCDPSPLNDYISINCLFLYFSD